MKNYDELLRHGHRLHRLLNILSSIHSLKHTKSLHALTLTMGPTLYQPSFFHNNVISSYLSLAHPLLAHNLFHSLPHKTLVSYNTLIAHHARNADIANAWALFCEMRHFGLWPTQYTISGLLLCEALGFSQGVLLYGFSVKSGLFCVDAFVGTNLVVFFGRHGCLDEVFLVFDDMPQKSLVTWNSMLSVLANNGSVDDCLLMFRDLLRMGVSLSEYSFGAVLSALESEHGLKYGEQLHCLMAKFGFDCQANAFDKLIRMYAKCKGIVLAEKLLDHMPIQNVVSWNMVIDAWAKSERPQMVLKLFSNMSGRGLKPSQATFVTVISSCTNLNVLAYGEFMHGKVIRSGFESDVIVGTALVDLYAKCGELESAHDCFDEIEHKNLVSWNALILGYSNKCSPTSLILLQQMLQLGYRPNEFSFSAVLKSSLASDLHQLHSLIIRMGYENYGYVLSSLLMSYTRNGFMNEAMAFVKDLDYPLPAVPSNIIAGMYNRTCQYDETLRFLSLLEKPDVVSWNVAIAAFARSNYYNEVFELFKRMQSADIRPDKYSFTSLLCVSTQLCNLALGSSLHGLVIKTGTNNCDTFLSNLLIDMYGKCGSIGFSVKVFEEVEGRNIITWTALITALGLNGYAMEAVTRFWEMEMTGLKPDALALRAVLSACRYGGLVREGMEIFRKMTIIYGIQPEIDHYHFIVDLLAKNGCVVEAEKIIAIMPFPPNANIWRSFLEGYKRPETGNLLV